MQPSERRKNKRINYKCSVRIRPMQEGIHEDKIARWDIVTMQNLSASGLLFTTMTKLAVGTMLELTISSSICKEPVHCIGQVSRVSEKDGNKISTAQLSVYLIAAIFKNIDAETKKAIKKICDEYLAI